MSQDESLSPLRSAQAAQAYAESIVDTVREPLLILDNDLRVHTASRSFYQMFQVSPEETIGTLVYDLGNGQWNIPALRELLEAILPNDSRFDDYLVTHDFDSLGRRTMLLNARKLYRPGNHMRFLLLAIEDVTEREALVAEREGFVARLTRELEYQTRIAKALQRPLLLEIPEDAFPGIKVATLYSATRVEEAEVGGDFFDMFPLADGRVAAIVGDVTGKGLAAAARAQECKDVLRAMLRLYPFYPAVSLTRLNDYYCDAQSLDERTVDTILALSIAVFNVGSKEVSIAWAGEAPIIQSASGAVSALKGGGTLIGALEHTTYAEVTLPFRTGDTILLYTDGLSEARRGKEFLDQEGVTKILESVHRRPVRDVAETLLADARAFSGGILRDDACIVVARAL